MSTRNRKNAQDTAGASPDRWRDDQGVTLRHLQTTIAEEPEKRIGSRYGEQGEKHGRSRRDGTKFRGVALEMLTGSNRVTKAFGSLKKEAQFLG